MPDDRKQSRQGARVLIVEDEVPIRKLLCRWLADMHVCEAVESVEQARSIMAQRAFDLLVCDIELPGESGLRLAEEVIDGDLGIAVVMVTGQDAPALWHAALEKGVYGYLLKPVDRIQLIIGVENALERHRLEHQRRIHLGRLKRLIERLRQVNKALKTSNQRILAQQQEIVAKERWQAMFEVAGTMAHEMNQPLMTLLGHAELMRQDVDDPEKLIVHAKKVSASGWRLAEVVKKLQAIHQDRPNVFAKGVCIQNLHQDAATPAGGEETSKG